MCRARGTLLAIGVTFAMACSKPPSEKDTISSMVSWIATGDMASQAWLNHTTFDRYTRETLELSARVLGDQSDQLKKSAPGHSATLDSAVTNARHSMTIIAGLIAAHDAPAVEVNLDSLRAAKKIVVAISGSLDKQ